jgi:beta-lactamase regulating signal transducer with metallopeptidase domain
VVFGVWLAGATLAFLRLERQRRALRLQLEDAAPLGDARVAALARALAGAGGLAAPPPLFVSGRISAPMVVGLGRPRIVLPARSVDTLDEGSLQMALAHELAHVRRRDLWLGWVPAIADGLFWFWPLVRLCAREFAQAREEACDADALALTGASPAEYGQLLIAFGVAHRGAGAHAACGASPHFQHLRRRLTMLQHVSSNRSRWWSLAAVIALPALIPFRVVAKEAPVAATAPASPRAPRPVAAARTATPASPAAPATPASPRVSHRVTQLNPGSAHGDAYVYVQGESSTMSGNTDQLRAARALRGKYGDRFVWVRRAGKAYVIDDPASLAKLDPLVTKERALGDQQTALGDQQSALGEKQSALGAQQSALGDTMSKLGEQQGALAERLAAGRESDADRTRSETLSAQMEEAGGKMNALGQKMDALGSQMDALGTQMDAQGQRMEAVSHDFERALYQVTTDAISRGVAHPVD